MKIAIILFAIVLIVVGAVYATIEDSISSLHEEIKENFETITNEINEMGKSLDQSIENINRSMDKKISSLNSSVEILGERVRILEEKVKQRGPVNPSYYELVKFVREDDTNTYTYKEENYEFICADFSNLFISRFKEKGYYSCPAYIYLYDMDNFKEGAHSIVAVETTDNGIVFVEPQNDYIMSSLKVGENYCLKVGWACNWQIRKIKTCFDF